MVSGCCKCQICAEKVKKQHFGVYLNKLLDGIHWGEAESLVNFEELLESYPYCHLYVLYPYFLLPMVIYGLYGIMTENKQIRDSTWIIIISLL